MNEMRAISRRLVGAIEATGASGMSNDRAVHIERVTIILRRLLLNNAVQAHKMIARNRRLGTMAGPSPRVEARATVIMPSRLGGLGGGNFAVREQVFPLVGGMLDCGIG